MSPFALAALFFCLVSMLPAEEVWYIALRDDGEVGSGAVADPLDGSTPERLEAAFQRIPEGRRRVELGPGVFPVRATLDVKSGWTVAGAGMGRTTLRLVDGVLRSRGDTVLIIGRSDFVGAAGLQEWACVRDLSIDGNRQGQPIYHRRLHGGIDAVRLWAKDGRIENVHVRNTFAEPGEAFPVTIYSTGGTAERPHRAEIVGVQVDYHEGPATCIAAFDQTGGRLSGGIRRCVVNGYGRRPSGIAFGAGGWQDFAIEDNRVDGMSAGMVIDTHDYAGVHVSGNVFTRLWQFGILANGSGRYDRLTVVRNRMEVTPRAQQPGAILKFDSARVRDLRVEDNDLRGNRHAVPIETEAAAQGVLRGNRLARGQRFKLPPASGLRVVPTAARAPARSPRR